MVESRFYEVIIVTYSFFNRSTSLTKKMQKNVYIVYKL